MRKILSYLKSHIYELHAGAVATVVVLIMLLVKPPIKRKIVHIVELWLEQHPEQIERKTCIVKRCNIILIILTMFLAIGGFAVLAALSPFVEFSFPTAIMSGVFALCEYAFLEQITFDNRG